MKYAILLSVMLVTGCTYVEAAKEAVDKGVEAVSQERYELMVRGRQAQCVTVSYSNEQRFKKQFEIAENTYKDWCGREQAR